jgi:hypothetical protein
VEPQPVEVGQNAEAAVAEEELIPKTILLGLLLTKEEAEVEENLPEVRAVVPKEVTEAIEVTKKEVTTKEEEETPGEAEEATSVPRISSICYLEVKKRLVVPMT